MKSRFSDISLGVIAFGVIFGVGYMVHGAQQAQLFGPPGMRQQQGMPAMPRNDDQDGPPVGMQGPDCPLQQTVCSCTCNGNDGPIHATSCRDGYNFPAGVTQDCGAYNGLACGPEGQDGKLEGCVLKVAESPTGGGGGFGGAPPDGEGGLFQGDNAGVGGGGLFQGDNGRR